MAKNDRRATNKIDLVQASAARRSPRFYVKHLPEDNRFEDHRAENPGLHALYVGWAMQHLQVIDQCLELHVEAGLDSNINCQMTMSALREMRTALIEGNAAYQEAVWRVACGHTFEEDVDGIPGPVRLDDDDSEANDEEIKKS